MLLALTSQELQCYLSIFVTVGGAIWWASDMSAKTKAMVDSVDKLTKHGHDLVEKVHQLEMRVHDLDKKGHCRDGSGDQG